MGRDGGVVPCWSDFLTGGIVFENQNLAKDGQFSSICDDDVSFEIWMDETGTLLSGFDLSQFRMNFGRYF